MNPEKPYDPYIDNLVKAEYEEIDQVTAGRLLREILPSAYIAVLRVPEAWQSLHAHWQDLVQSNRSRASLALVGGGVGYQGKSATTEKRIDKAFKIAAKEDSEYLKASAMLEGEVHPRFFVEDTAPCYLLSIVRKHDGSLSAVDDISVLRTKLVHSVFKIITQAASDKYRELQGNILDYDDLVMEGWATAWESTLRYDPDKGHFSTIVLPRIYGQLTNYIADFNQTVRVPRNLVEKMKIVRDATHETTSVDPEVLAKQATILLAQRKGRKLKRKEVITPDLVSQLLDTMQGPVSFDAAVSKEEGREVSLAETFSTDAHDTAEDQFILENSLQRFKKILPGMLTSEEWKVLSIRWGLVRPFTEPQSIDNTILEYHKKYRPRRKLTRPRMREMERAALHRLAASGHLKEIWATMNEIRGKEE